MAWIEITRRQYRREGLRYASGLAARNGNALGSTEQADLPPRGTA
jgi:hypothetical protein